MNGHDDRPTTTDRETVPDAPSEIAPAVAHFNRGDFYRAEREARLLLARTPLPPHVDVAARALLNRLAPDRWALLCALGATALLVLLAVTHLGARG